MTAETKTEQQELADKLPHCADVELSCLVNDFGDGTVLAAINERNLRLCGADYAMRAMLAASGQLFQRIMNSRSKCPVEEACEKNE